MKTKKDNNIDLDKVNEKVNDILRYIDSKKLHYIELKVLEAIIHERCATSINGMIRFKDKYER